MASSRLLVLATCGALVAQTSAGADVDYITQIKPILAARCYACHSALRKKSGLRLDTAALLAAGGDSGPAIKPGDAESSLFISMVTGELGTRMPPEGDGEALSAEQIELFNRWINEGAHAPPETPLPDPRDHWAFKPPLRPAVPTVQNAAWVINPIDAFVADVRQSSGLRPVAPAAKAVLLRRVYFDLIGLPPTREELHSFLADESPKAYEQVVDRLLASPQYGERWGRHWMDVWRYSDWSGYMEELRNSARHIWHWRDWIVESLNTDKGYDRMVLEMLAGDELAPGDADALRATGFLARNWFKFNRNVWLDSTVEHTSKAFLGLTMNCARCHDHKYDPISQVNYYQFRAVFEPHDIRTERVPGEADVLKDGLPRAFDAKPQEPTYIFTRGNEKQPQKEHAVNPGVPDFLGQPLATSPVSLPVTAYYPALKESVLAEDLERGAKTVEEKKAALGAARIALSEAQKKLSALPAESSDKVATVRARDVALAAVELAEKQVSTARAAQGSLAGRIAAEKAKYGLTSGVDSAALALAASTAERESTLATAKEQQAAAAHELAVAQAALAHEAASSDAVKAAQAKLPAVREAIAASHVALATAGSDYKPLGDVLPATSTGRRLALARWIVDVQNPLAARVAVNHIWQRHIGAPLVDNMFDFGVRSPQARNQRLLDWLAVELMEHSWQMKHIHRLIVTSNTYRMKSSGEANSPGTTADPDNRLLWRMNARRLEAEAVRDAVLFAAGKLDATLGGPDIDYHLAGQSSRRSLYLRHAYEKQARFLELFDGASVNECYRRSESIVPQQALALMNSDVSLDQSRNLAATLIKEADSDPASQARFVTLAFETVLGRSPTHIEVEDCGSFLAAQSDLLSKPEKLTAIAGGAKNSVEPSKDPAPRARENLVHVLFNHNDFVTIR